MPRLLSGLRPAPFHLPTPAPHRHAPHRQNRPSPSLGIHRAERRSSFRPSRRSRPGLSRIPSSDGELRALGLFTQLADVLVEVEIFDAWDNGPSGFLGSGNYTLDDIGYFQVELPESLALTAADSIVVQLTYLDALTLDPALGALGITIGGAGLNFDTNTNSVASGLSYYLDGSAWTDFATLDYPIYDGATPLLFPSGVHGGVLFLKGITAVPEPSALLLGLAAAAAMLLPRLVRNRKASSQN